MNNLPDFIDIESAAAANLYQGNNLPKTNVQTNAGIQTNNLPRSNSVAMQLTSIADQLKSIANSLSSNAPLPSMPAMPAMPANNRKNKNNALSKTKKVRTASQLARNENMRRASASLKEKGYKATIKSIHELLKHRKEGKQNEEYFSTLGLPTIKEETTTNINAAEGEGVINTKTKLVEAGKKAATSEKGSKWLDEIKSAKKMLNSEFAKSGLKKTAKQQNAIKVASLLRKNQAAAQNYISKLLKPE